MAIVTGGVSGALTGLLVLFALPLLLAGQTIDFPVLLDQVSPNLVVVLLALIGGCVQLAGDDGLYWIAAASALSLVGGVVNAWLFMTRT